MLSVDGGHSCRRDIKKALACIYIPIDLVFHLANFLSRTLSAPLPSVHLANPLCVFFSSAPHPFATIEPADRMGYIDGETGTSGRRSKDPQAILVRTPSFLRHPF